MHVFMKKCENCVNGIEKICNAVYNPVLNSFESVKMSQTLYLKALGPFFARP